MIELFTILQRIYIIVLLHKTYRFENLTQSCTCMIKKFLLIEAVKSLVDFISSELQVTASLYRPNYF